VPRLSAPFVAEGGALAFDGRGTVITTRSCLLNPNRNPVGFRRDRQRFIVSGFRTLGIRKVIWLEGDSCEPITSGHIDGYVVFAPGNLILVEVIDETDAERPFWREHDTDLLRKAKNGRSLGLKIIDVLAPRERYLRRHSGNFAANYLNVYIANGAVIVSQFGDPKRDALVQEKLAYAFPGREIVALKIDAISAGGGGVHCLTQSMPLVKKSKGE
jgi:agmatine deiminase